MAVSLPTAEVVLGLVGGGGLTQLGNWLLNRSKATAYSMGAVDHAVKTAFGGMETVVDGLRKEVGRLTEKVEAVEGKHDACETELDASRKDRADLRAQLDKLMSEPIARIGEHPPE